MTFKQIFTEFEKFIVQYRDPYVSWYFGITSGSKMDSRLYDHHKVSKLDAPFIWDADDHKTARQVVDYFLEKGTDGDPTWGDRDDKIVYAYLKTATTKP